MVVLLVDYIDCWFRLIVCLNLFAFVGCFVCVVVIMVVLVLLLLLVLFGVFAGVYVGCDLWWYCPYYFVTCICGLACGVYFTCLFGLRLFAVLVFDCLWFVYDLALVSVIIGLMVSIVFCCCVYLNVFALDLSCLLFIVLVLVWCLFVGLTWLCW